MPPAAHRPRRAVRLPVACSSLAIVVTMRAPGAVLAINQMFEEGLRGLGAPKAVMWSELGGLVVTLVLLAALLKPIGIMGAAIASLFGYAAVTIQLLFWTRELTGSSFSELLLPRGAEVVRAFDQARLWLRDLRGAAAE